MKMRQKKCTWFTQTLGLHPPKVSHACDIHFINRLQSATSMLPYFSIILIDSFQECFQAIHAFVFLAWGPYNYYFREYIAILIVTNTYFRMTICKTHMYGIGKCNPQIHGFIPSILSYANDFYNHDVSLDLSFNMYMNEVCE